MHKSFYDIVIKVLIKLKYLRDTHIVHYSYNLAIAIH